MSYLRPVHEDMEPSNRNGKIFAAAIVALALTGIGVGAWQAGAFAPSSVVADNQLPSPGLPVVSR